MNKGQYLHQLRNIATKLQTIKMRNDDSETLFLVTAKEMAIVNEMSNLLDISHKYLPENKEL